jgi:hypothetical protein
MGIKFKLTLRREYRETLLKRLSLNTAYKVFRGALITIIQM